jgi:hypothetical protein
VKLIKLKITNFRSIEDSEEFAVDDMLCLVGKNEAGKSAVLQAIAGLNPHPLTPISYDKERDYPRRYLTAYAQRHPKGEGEAVVATTWWQIEDEERLEIEEQIGPEGLKSTPVEILRRYGASAPEWDLPSTIEKPWSF